MKSLGFLLLLACGMLLQSCAQNSLPRPSDLPSFGDLPFVHKIDIQQGNVITQEMIAQLAVGMDKKKVIFIMGSPIILDTFHTGRWDYLYVFKQGGSVAKRRQITLYFSDNKLARIEGDIKPAAGKLVVDTRQDMTVDVPKAAHQGLIAKIKDNIPFVGEPPPPAKTKADGKKVVVLADDEVPDIQTPAKAAPALTPVQRAALEEQGGPGVLAKIKMAMPFSGDSAAAPLTAQKIATKKPAKPSAKAAPQPAEVAESPGLLAKLKGALPFGQAAPETAAPQTAHPQHATRKANQPESSAPDESRSARREADSVDAAEETAAIIIPPPGAPTAMPLENQLSREATAAATPRKPASTASDDLEGVDVPAQPARKKRGFFARLFGKDRPADESPEPDNRERRRYRDPSDPDAN